MPAFERDENLEGLTECALVEMEKFKKFVNAFASGKCHK